MRTRILSLGCALALSVMAIAAGPARAAACPGFVCSQQRKACLAGCPCADFYCDSASCVWDCVCPTVCPQ